MNPMPKEPKPVGLLVIERGWFNITGSPTRTKDIHHPTLEATYKAAWHFQHPQNSCDPDPNEDQGSQRDALGIE
ncbi:hypothetical protein Nepgr_028922 [Nepenthes gracilis]|uniref:Uncharacterized protein n=1 Tax=Nepenthes gracilis TaxID=150966 RepID=A0AAD3TDS7_NEPGR|nr:hypothetical protein Nepgr_028922 [Nepenthes gracilis]